MAQDAHARRIADMLGRPWQDCGAYERQSFADYPPSAQAIEEGWCIAWSDTRARYEIQRDDDDGYFQSDEEARAHVDAQAQAGSEYHQQALDFIAFISQSPAE